MWFREGRKGITVTKVRIVKEVVIWIITLFLALFAFRFAKAHRQHVLGT